MAKLARIGPHFDHVGNTLMFPTATWYVQRDGHDSIFGDGYRDYGFIPDLYATMTTNPQVLVDGDFDVFGDGSATILRTPGHTPGHESLLVRLPNAGAVVLSGDVAHFCDNLRHRRVPTFNADQGQSVRSMDRVESIVRDEQAQLLVNHDAGQNSLVRRIPDAIDSRRQRVRAPPMVRIARSRPSVRTIC